MTCDPCRAACRSEALPLPVLGPPPVKDIATRAPYAQWVKSCARKMGDMNASK